LQLFSWPCHFCYTCSTVYVQIFEGRNFRCFCGQLIICENFILEISLLNLACVNWKAYRIHMIRLYSSGGCLGGGWHLVGANHGFHYILHGHYSRFWYIWGQFWYIELQTSLEVVGNIRKILSHDAGCNHVVNQIRVISVKFDWQIILENNIMKILNWWNPQNLHASKICTYMVFLFIYIHTYVHITYNRNMHIMYAWL